MPKPRPEPRLASDELKRMMFVSWGDLVRSGMLEDVDRAARLHGLVKDPYHELALGDLSREDKILICAHRLMEEGDWKEASRLLLRLDRIDREKARLARQRRQPLPEPVPVPEPEPEPEPEREPPPMLFGRRWTWPQITQFARKYPNLRTMPRAEILEAVASFPPAPDT